MFFLQKYNVIDKQGHILYDSTYMRYLKWSIYKDKTEWWLPEAGGKSDCVMGMFLEMDGGDDGCVTM